MNGQAGKGDGDRRNMKVYCQSPYWDKPQCIQCLGRWSDLDENGICKKCKTESKGKEDDSK